MLNKTESTINGLYRIGGMAAICTTVFAALQIVIEIIGVGIMHIEIPSTVLGWFILLKDHMLLGLTALTMFQIPMFILCTPVFLAIYGSLKRTDTAYLTLATALAFLGIAIYLASNTAFSMLSLSRQYAAAITDEQRTIFLAAGQAMLTTYEGSAVDVGLFIFMIAVLIISIIMLRSNVFSRITANMGILAGIVSLAYYISSFFTSLAIFVFEAAGVIFVVWIALVGRRLLQLGNNQQIETVM